MMDSDHNPAVLESDSASPSSTGSGAPSIPVPVSAMSLSSSQMDVLTAISKGQSVFFSGAAGTGKSYILKILKDAAAKLGIGRRVAFTASTGVAACNIGGLTIHSWAGIGLGTESIEKTVAKASGRAELKARWATTAILVIDEISMLGGKTFSLISEVGKRLRSDPRPFGGIQLVLCGDFFQLPPIAENGSGSDYCFDCDAWNEIFFPSGSRSGQLPGRMMTLGKVFRQRDSTFLTILQEVRSGCISDRTKAILRDKQHEYALKKRIEEEEERRLSAAGGGGGDQSAGVVPKPKNIILYSRNEQVDNHNKRELAKLTGEFVQFKAIDAGEPNYLEQLRKGIKAPAVLDLAIGAQVLLLKNLETSAGLVNGSRGVIVDFQPALPEEVGFSDMVPLVEFAVSIAGIDSTVTRLIGPESFETTSNDRILASRKQLPLMLAWAISIHKSQGMTIPFLEFSFTGMFAAGQAYVALSRGTDLHQIAIQNFDASKIRTDPRVVDYYRSIGWLPSTGSSSSSSPQKTATDDVVETSMEALVAMFQPHLSESSIKQRSFETRKDDQSKWVGKEDHSRYVAEKPTVANGKSQNKKASSSGWDKSEGDDWLEASYHPQLDRRKTAGNGNTQNSSYGNGNNNSSRGGGNDSGNIFSAYSNQYRGDGDHDIGERNTHNTTTNATAAPRKRAAEIWNQSSQAAQTAANPTNKRPQTQTNGNNNNNSNAPKFFPMFHITAAAAAKKAPPSTSSAGTPLPLSQNNSNGLGSHQNRQNQQTHQQASPFASAGSMLNRQQPSSSKSSDIIVIVDSDSDDGIKRHVMPHVTAVSQPLSDEQKRTIEAKRQAALQRLKENRLANASQYSQA